VSARILGRLIVVAALTGLGLVVPLVPVVPAVAGGGGCNALNTVIGDIDSDGIADVVASAPRYGDYGAVSIHLSRGGSQVVTASGLGFGASAANDFFGDATAVADLNADGCDDLVIGAPGRSSGSGAVYIGYGSTTGITASGSRYLSAIQADSGFGSALAVLAPVKGATLAKPARIVVGAPGYTVGSLHSAGAVAVYQHAPDGTISSPTVITQNTAGVPGTAKAGDAFGMAVAAWGRTIVIGAPWEKVGHADSAGTVTVLKLSGSTTLTVSGKVASKATSGVPGSPQIAGYFGSSVAILGSRIAVGVPGNTFGDDDRAGLVQLFSWKESTRKLTPKKAIHQNTKHVPGVVAGENEFGASIAFGRGLLTRKVVTLVVGVPGENAGGVAACGRVMMIEYSSTGTVTKAKAFAPGAGITGSTVDEAGFGTAVGILRGDESLGTSVRDSLLVGEPYWAPSGGAASDEGRVWRTGNWSAGWSVYHFASGDVSEADYGGGIAAPGGVR
jgi:hypothetical protein